MFDDSCAVRGVRQRQVEELCVSDRLLEAVARQAVLAFRLDEPYGKAGHQLEQVIGTKATLPAMATPNRDDPSIRDGVLLDELFVVPAGSAESRDDVVAARF